MEQYRLNEEAAAKRLDEFRDDDPSDLSRELALCRYLLEDTTKAKNFGLVATLLGTIGRLAKEFEASQLRRSRYVHKTAVARFCQEVVATVADELRDVPQWESRVDRIVGRLQAGLLRIENQKKELDDLLGRPR